MVSLRTCTELLQQIQLFPDIHISFLVTFQLSQTPILRHRTPLASSPSVQQLSCHVSEDATCLYDTVAVIRKSIKGQSAVGKSRLHEDKYPDLMH